MATAPTAGYIYFVESESVGGDDWITDHAGDPDLMDLSLMTEGTEFCKLEIPQRWRKQFTTGIVVTDAGGGTSFDLRSARRGYMLSAEGIETSITNADLVEQFFMIDRHTSGASATFKAYYMVIYLGVNLHVKFKDSTTSAMLSYCPVRSMGGEIVWTEDKPQTVIFRANVRSVM